MTQLPRSFRKSWLPFAVLAFLSVVAPAAGGQGSQARRPVSPWPTQFRSMSAPFHVFRRGNVEILTFETKQDYDRLQQLYQQSQETTPRPGVLTTRYFRSKIDGSVQPYSLWLPRSYTSGHAYPLIVQLHGLNFHKALSHWPLHPPGKGPNLWIEPDLPVIYIQCFGRASTFYQGMGEQDVLEAISDVEKHFSVDPNHVYIMGHSMGGAGAVTIGLHYPDRFGGITAIDPALWSKMARHEDVPEWVKPQVAIESIVNLYPNARNAPVFFKNAGNGLQRRSTEFMDGIVAAGGFATTEFFPGLPHYFAPMYAFSDFIPELIQHPIAHAPAQVKFYTDTLQYNRAYWITIDQLALPDADAFVEATYIKGGRSGLIGPQFQITGTNIAALTLRPGESPAPKNSSVAILINGERVFSGPLPEVIHLSRSHGQWNVAPWEFGALAKRHGLQGPIGDAFNSRFLAVYGEGNRNLAIAELDSIRNPRGPLVVQADFPMKSAANVTPEDIRSSNLILFGTPQSNAVLKRIASVLPRELMQPRPDGARAIFIYPNPENPARYVVVWSTKLLSCPDPGVHAQWIMPLNLLPDYVWVKGCKAVSGGFFDNRWKLTGK